MPVQVSVVSFPGLRSKKLESIVLLNWVKFNNTLDRIVPCRNGSEAVLKSFKVLC